MRVITIWFNLFQDGWLIRNGANNDIMLFNNLFNDGFINWVWRETGYYKVNVIDEFDFLLSEPKAYYKPGTKIVIKTIIIYDESYHIYVNGVELRSSGYGDHCNIYEFTMPEEDVELLLTFKDLYEKYEYQIYQLFGKIENIDKVAIYHKKQSFDEFDTREFSTDINDDGELFYFSSCG